MVAIDQEAPVLKANTVQELAVLRALKALSRFDRFTLARPAALAGLRASAVRTLLEHWQEQGFPLLKEVGDKRSETPSQLPKPYMPNPEMHAAIEAAIAAADPSLTLSLRRADASWKDNNRAPREPITQLDFLDIAKEMLAGGDQAAEPENRTKLYTEASELIEQCFAILHRRAEAGCSGPSPAFQEDLELTRDQVAQKLQTSAPIAPTL